MPVSKIRVASACLCAVAAATLLAGCGDDDDSDDDAPRHRSPVSLERLHPRPARDEEPRDADGRRPTSPPSRPTSRTTTRPTARASRAPTAYAIADQLGYDPRPRSSGRWCRSTPPTRPGPKDFDFDVNQISITPEARRAGRLLGPYYEAEQAVVALKDSDAAQATSLAELRRREHRRPDRDHEPRRGQRGDPAVERAAGLRHLQRRRPALKNGQVDAVVVDVPTAFFLTAVQVPEATIVGQFPAPGGDTVGRAAGEGLAADRLRLGGDRRAERVRASCRRSRSSG